MPKRDKHIEAYKKKDGKTYYRYKTYLGLDPLTGKRVFAGKAGFTSYNDAKVSYDKARAAGVTGSVSQKKTFGEVYKLWLEAHKLQVKPSTIATQSDIVKNHILPYFGTDDISKIKPIKYQQWVIDLAKSYAAYRLTISIFNQIYDYGVSLGACDKLNNPNLMASIPAVRREKRMDNYYSQEELAEFLEAADKISHKSYIYFRLLALTGLRRSEALALTWSDVTPETIAVTKTLTGVGVQTPKTRRSNRLVPIDDVMYNLLLDLKQPGVDVIFANKFGAYHNIAAPRYWLQKIYQSNPQLRKITIHGFRHTFASLMTGAGLADVQLIMGHSSADMTIGTYTHQTDSSVNRIREQVKKLETDL
ncbi:tyrosine-type recombinase/integrase [Lactobacillus delbrueckii]|uniref:tyrosine-type recombinase/integrase n=1 Tax=Lactobacillus delbrueckii TaxID=1584 RepID=UPI001E4962D4|nr:site-specific integrase [Lactobacillus delbrueckii]MCD5445399.1 site-specific integrase [Lactobacillus delbrueckii subsp. lactis]